MPSFLAYPSAAQSFQPYDRSQALACDQIDHDDMAPYGHFDPLQHCFVADQACTVAFHAQVIWSVPPNTAGLAMLLFKNVLPPPGGANNGEIAGMDTTTFQGPSPQSVGNQVLRILKLNAGDKIWAVPCIAGHGTLTAGEISNCFEGHLV